MPIDPGTAMLGAGAIGAGGNILGALITSQGDSGAAQARAMREIYKWGYGYPDWLLEAIERSVERGGMDPEGFQQYLAQLRELGPEAYEQYQEVDRLIDAMKARPGVTEQYRGMAKAEFGTGARALEELGMTGGALERARLGMGTSLAQALQQASVQGEQVDWQRQAQLASMAQAAQGMLPGAAGLYGAPIEAQAANEQRLVAALAGATGIPGYQYTPPRVPGTGEFMVPAIASAFSGLGQAWAYNQGMQQQPGQYQQLGGSGQWPGGWQGQMMSNYPGWNQPPESYRQQQQVGTYM